MSIEAELATLVVEADPPRCEVANDCEEHGPEVCGTRARWKGEVTAKHSPGCKRTVFLACDGCQESLCEDGLGDGREVVWSTL